MCHYEMQKHPHRAGAQCQKSKKKTAPRRATCPAEGKEFLPMIAVHITKKAGYDAIVKAREIRPRGRKRRHGE